MKYVQINAYANGWADAVVFAKHRALVREGVESYVFWACGDHDESAHMRRIATYPAVCLDALQTRLDGKAGFHSRATTARLIAQLDEIDPDFVHLHVLTGYYLNVEMLFTWLARHRCRVRWTLHDCWAFTGHCIHFSSVGCEQWRTGCARARRCPQVGAYPQTLCASSVRKNYERKKRLFTMVPPERMQLFTPSRWLANLVEQSFLSAYRVTVLPNAVNAAVFKPTPSDFRERYGLSGAFVVLGVASRWTAQKGMADFERLARALVPEGRCAVVLIGLDDGQIHRMRKRAPGVVALPRTDSARELAAAYSAADVLYNSTREDNFPSVNLEAEACGTPVVTYDVGGCKETISLEESRAVAGFDEACALLRERRDGNG